MSDMGRTFRFRVDANLPPLMWLARIHRNAPIVDVTLGTSVQCGDRFFFEGTWAGDGDVAALPTAMTVFGSGIVASGSELLVVTPTHAMSGVFVVDQAGVLSFSNSVVALLAATGLELDRNADYPSRFARVMEGIGNSPIQIPTSTVPIRYHFYRNLRVDEAGDVTEVAKPVEAPFSSYADYRRRLSNAVGSALANAGGRPSAVSVSSGYDSTAVAVIAAENGCQQALTFRAGRATRRNGGDTADSGEATARRLGMAVDVFDRTSYLHRDDLVEAEFLATGMSGEDVIMSAYEPFLRHGILLTGTQGNGIWKFRGSKRTDISRQALDGTSLQEFRLRTDFHFIPVPLFGMSQRPSVIDITVSPEMEPFSVGGTYNQPISRRIAEEAGVPRGTFALKKQAASAVIHTEGEQALSAATAAAIRRFAAAEGTQVVYPAFRREARWRRAALKFGPKVRANRLVTELRWQHKRRSHFQAEIGNVLFRWGVSVVRPRYANLESTPDHQGK